MRFPAFPTLSGTFWRKSSLPTFLMPELRYALQYWTPMEAILRHIMGFPDQISSFWVNVESTCRATGCPYCYFGARDGNKRVSGPLRAFYEPKLACHCLASNTGCGTGLHVGAGVVVVGCVGSSRACMAAWVWCCSSNMKYSSKNLSDSTFFMPVKVRKQVFATFCGRF